MPGTKRPQRPRKSNLDVKPAAPAQVFQVRSSGWLPRHAESAVRLLAPGGPGDETHWSSSAKDGVGTALGTGAGEPSRVWFTLAQGMLTEVFHPRCDRACTRSLALVVTDGEEFFSDERTDTDHRIELPIEGVPLYRLINTCRQGRYRLVKTIFAHPHHDAIVQTTRFEPIRGSLGDYRLHVLLTPHIDNRGRGNTAWLGEHRGHPMLMASRAQQAVALGCSARWTAGSAGFVGPFDGWHDLQEHKRLTREYDRAEDGNVMLSGELDLADCAGNFVLVLGFGTEAAEAGHRTLSVLADDLQAAQAECARAWNEWQSSLPAPRAAGAPGGRDLYRISTAVLRTHGDHAIPGAMIASLSEPWGETRGDSETQRGTGGYHLVWPRDLVESAGGLLAAGAVREARQVLAYLRATQMADGHWTQNFWVDSASHQTGTQMGETALPLLLVDLLRREGALSAGELARYWPMVRRGAGYIVRNGPSTQQDRWENQRGYTPFTVAAAVAALLVADHADSQGEPDAGIYLRESADAWNSAVESWLYVTGTDLAQRLGIDGYYARIIPPELDEGATPRLGHVRLKETSVPGDDIPATEVVSPDALALVRFGLRQPDDPRIVATVRAIDDLLKRDTPYGPSWRRYNGDRYGEQEDGSPFVRATREGVGRSWPLLTGERAHFELAAGRREQAVRLLHAMELFAGPGGMIPEQVWDGDDLPERGLLQGHATGSAMPLAWAHAEYLKLRRSLQDNRIYDTPPQTVARYLKDKAASNRVIWRFDNQRTWIAPGDVLRIEALAPAAVHWTSDGWQTSHERKTRDTGLGIHVADLDTGKLTSRQTVELTFFWTDAERWEGRNFRVVVS